jgi:hypothetical protein
MCDSDRTLPAAALPHAASRLTKWGELSGRLVLWLKLALGGAPGMGGLGHVNSQPAMAAATAAESPTRVTTMRTDSTPVGTNTCWGGEGAAGGTCEPARREAPPSVPAPRLRHPRACRPTT